jgi:F-type H+-transporting ATPase subunit alpha
LFKQIQYNPFSMEEEVVQLWAAQQGFFESTPVEKTREVRSKFLDFIRMRRKELLLDIAREKRLTPEIRKALEDAVTEYQGLN